MLQPELKLRRDKIRVLMAQQEIDAALITCNVNLIYTYGRVVSGYLYLPLNAPTNIIELYLFVELTDVYRKLFKPN